MFLLSLDFTMRCQVIHKQIFTWAMYIFRLAVSQSVSRSVGRSVDFATTSFGVSFVTLMEYLRARFFKIAAVKCNSFHLIFCFFPVEKWNSKKNLKFSQTLKSFFCWNERNKKKKLFVSFLTLSSSTHCSFRFCSFLFSFTQIQNNLAMWVSQVSCRWFWCGLWHLWNWCRSQSIRVLQRIKRKKDTETRNKSSE